MNYLQRSLVAVLLLVVGAQAEAACPPLLEFESRLLRSDKSVNFCTGFKSAKALLVVNTASQCGYTPQFKGLEALYQKYKDQGLMIVGFPSDDFNQEFSEEAKTADVCYVNYGVTFPMLATSSVKGSSANALFKALANQTQKAPTWNFNKYLIETGEGKAQHFGSSETPSSLEDEVAALLHAQ
tara:strand:- start:513 stop:1061 length:549 start_codon:yes stop_codon:yes gene_type:complete